MWITYGGNYKNSFDSGLLKYKLFVIEYAPKFNGYRHVNYKCLLLLQQPIRHFGGVAIFSSFSTFDSRKKRIHGLKSKNCDTNEENSRPLNKNLLGLDMNSPPMSTRSVRKNRCFSILTPWGIFGS
jgi:hypothetical protein